MIITIVITVVILIIVMIIVMIIVVIIILQYCRDYLDHNTNLMVILIECNQKKNLMH